MSELQLPQGMAISLHFLFEAEAPEHAGRIFECRKAFATTVPTTVEEYEAERAQALEEAVKQAGGPVRPVPQSRIDDYADMVLNAEAVAFKIISAQDELRTAQFLGSFAGKAGEA